jgi:RNA polymerase sigma factor (sigma-70 family)
MLGDPTVVALVTAAVNGDQAAWNRLVERYAPLVWAICRRYDLSRPDIDDIGQSVWLKLVEHLPTLREPAAVPGWIATTTRNECLRVLRSPRHSEYVERLADYALASDGGYEELERELDGAKRRIALREAFAQLRPECRDLLSRLFADVGTSYREISAILGMKIGSIGPSRKRCLQDLRRAPALAALIEAAGHAEEGGENRGAHPLERRR